MIRLAFAILAKSGSLDDYVKAVLENQVSSKDIASWPAGKLRKQCQEKLDWAREHFNPFPKKKLNTVPAFIPTITIQQEIQMRGIAESIIDYFKLFRKQKTRFERAKVDMYKLIRRIYLHAGRSIAARSDTRLEFQFSMINVIRAGKEEKIRNPRLLFDALRKSRMLFYQHWKDEKGFQFSIAVDLRQSRQYRFYLPKEPMELQSAFENALSISYDLSQFKRQEFDVRVENLLQRYSKLLSKLNKRSLRRAFEEEYQSGLCDNQWQKARALLFNILREANKWLHDRGSPSLPIRFRDYDN